MYLSLLLEKIITSFEYATKYELFSGCYAQIHLSERKHPVLFGLFILKIFFLRVEYGGFDRQTLQLIPGCDVQDRISHTCF